MAGTVISSAAVNSDLSDIATALTGSFARDGQSTMLGQFKALDGSLLAPGYSFANEINTGLTRPAAGQIGVVIQGVQVATFASTGINSNFTGGTFTGTFSGTFLGLVIPRGYLSGVILSTAGASTSFGVSVGMAVDSTNVDWIQLTVGSFTKTTAAWVVGTGNGALDAGAIAASTWYHVYLIKRPDTGVVDVLISLSATAPTLPANYTLFRRIGSMKTNGSSQWIAFSQINDEFLWLVQTQDSVNVTFSSTATLAILNVPSNIQVGALVTVEYSNVSTVWCLITSTDQTDVAASATQFTMLTSSSGTNAIFNSQVRTSTAQQIRIRTDVSTGATGNIFTKGWIDTRGKLL